MAVFIRCVLHAATIPHGLERVVTLRTKASSGHKFMSSHTSRTQALRLSLTSLGGLTDGNRSLRRPKNTACVKTKKNVCQKLSKQQNLIELAEASSTGDRRRKGRGSNV